MQKRGAIEAEMLFTIADVFVLLIIAALLFSEINDLQKNTSFEKTYVAADLASLMTAVQSFSGDVAIEYPLPLQLTIELSNNEIIVSDNGKPASHMFSKILSVVPAKVSSVTKVTLSKKRNEVTLL